jgi:hypothetical protein
MVCSLPFDEPFRGVSDGTRMKDTRAAIFWDIKGETPEWSQGHTNVCAPVQGHVMEGSVMITNTNRVEAGVRKLRQQGATPWKWKYDWNRHFPKGGAECWIVTSLEETWWPQVDRQRWQSRLSTVLDVKTHLEQKLKTPSEHE